MLLYEYCRGSSMASLDGELIIHIYCILVMCWLKCELCLKVQVAILSQALRYLSCHVLVIDSACCLKRVVASVIE